jgi:hypothetical protein
VNRFTLLLGLLAVLLVGAVGWLFWVQNSARTALLSLNLGFAAWQLAEPAPVPGIVAGSAGAGFLLGAVVFGTMALRSGRRARRAESQLATTREGPGDPPWTIHPDRAPRQGDDWSTVQKPAAAVPPTPAAEKSDGWK